MSLVKYYETQIWTSVTKLTKLPYGKTIMFFSGTQQGAPYCLRKPLTHNCWDPYVIPNSGASVLALRSLEHSWQCWQVGSLWGIMSLSLPWWFLMADSRARRVDVWEMHEHADNPLSGRWGEAACKSTCQSLPTSMPTGSQLSVALTPPCHFPSIYHMPADFLSHPVSHFPSLQWCLDLPNLLPILSVFLNICTRPFFLPVHSTNVVHHSYLEYSCYPVTST